VLWSATSIAPAARCRSHSSCGVSGSLSFFPPAPTPELVVDRSSSMGKANNSCSSGTRTRMMRKKKKAFASPHRTHNSHRRFTTSLLHLEHTKAKGIKQSRREEDRHPSQNKWRWEHLSQSFNGNAQGLLLFLFVSSVFACSCCNSLSYFSHGLLPFLKFANYLYSFNFWKTSCQGVCYVPTNLN